MELLEHINTLMSTSHLGDMHGNLLQKIFLIDNQFCMVACCVFLIGFTTDAIIKHRLRRHKRYLTYKSDR